MTGAVPLWSNVSDGDLVPAAAHGDREAFAEIYDRYADRLYDFCVGMIGDRDAAADCVQDAFCAAATDLGSLREPDKLRPWLYSIARHHAMRRLRHRYREEVSDAMPDVASHEAGPDTMAGRSELARVVAEAAGGLSDRDRNLLELSYRHGLDGPELAEALGVSLTSANTMVFRLRQTVERSLGALLVARDARTNANACPELKALLKGWDGQLTVLMRKRIARHIESCQICQQEQRRRVNPVALLGGAPVFIPAPDWLRDQTLDRVQLPSVNSSTSPTMADCPDSLSTSPTTADDPDNSSASSTTADTPDSSSTSPTTADDPDSSSTGTAPADDSDRSPRRRLQTAALIAIPLLFVGMGTTIVWSAPWQDISITPAVQTPTDPGPGNGPSPLITEVTGTPTPTAGLMPVPTAGTTRTPLPTQQSQVVPGVGNPDPNPDIQGPNPDVNPPGLPGGAPPIPDQNVDAEYLPPEYPEEDIPEGIPEDIPDDIDTPDPDLDDPDLDDDVQEPDEDPTLLAPSVMGSLSPSVLGSLNPSVTGPQNPSVTGPQNPSVVGSLNPSVVGSLNPSVLGPLTPPGGGGDGSSGGGSDDSSGGGGDDPPR